MSVFVQCLRVLLACFYLLSILITIPISFKVGGLYCGLSFTVTLFNLYFMSTTLSLVVRGYGKRFYVFLTAFIYYAQHCIIASMLYLFLSGFSNEELTKILRSGSQPESTLLEVLKSNPFAAHSNWLLYYYYYCYIVQPWQFVLSHSTAFFSLSEGFFTVLAIQAIGESHRWLLYEKNSNTWIITSLLISGGFITGSLYYLYRIYVTPVWELSIQTASLLGFTLSLVGGLGLYGIVSKKGSVIESSLFLAYIVRCIYEISPKLATTATDEILEIFKEAWQKHQRNISNTNNLLSYYHDVVLNSAEMMWESIVSKTATGEPFYRTSMFPPLRKLSAMFKPVGIFFKNFTISVPSSIEGLFQVTLKMASDSVSPAIVVNLFFRVLIFYSATKIIPALQRKDDRQLNNSRRIMNLLYWYSPCILIAMYTHLILQYSGELNRDLCLWGCNSLWPFATSPKIVVDSWGFWNWCNIFWTILVYGSELIGGKK
ncbi:ICE2 (YIL090W) [Zygosaccharomyces parabailii]|uniref:ZYBA0S04-06128g1_1 n=1 Tax=Zygosaccharomyces bailii (strain CLIB 213 / ATCC 58445 / CBS 680 / BCRC 21525 / NBRC 1098 / NCYC 1416 / NRRL Y-2227) TaxID=1333698 RepID=A0A8J2T6P8_ZYGB2|nr:ICE2 (YIL090W) [Zygosaccharomyces parabailii]CDF89516.1 ZYBA0S04-06128g1_1 [Zygosaccharomyces bailii CLIB 213]CDH08483.1 probable protein ICE2 [Zygosaccharomyces bailii ISA1307]